MKIVGSPFDSFSLDRGDMRIKGSALSFGKPLLRSFLLHPEGLHMTTGEEPWVRWFEGQGPQHFPSRAEKKDVTECLWEFIRLHRMNDAAVLRFAETWGILGIRPYRQIAEEEDISARVASLTAVRRGNGEVKNVPFDPLNPDALPPLLDPPKPAFWHCEKVSFWRRLSAHFDSILLCVAALNRDEEPASALWEKIINITAFTDKTSPAYWGRAGEGRIWNVGWDSEIKVTPENASIERQWHTILGTLAAWMRAVHIEFFFRRTDQSALALHLSTNGLTSKAIWTNDVYAKCERERAQEQPFFGSAFNEKVIGRMTRGSVLLNILVMQLVASIASPLYCCDVCGEPFPTDRKPRSDKAVLCYKKECKAEQGRRRAAKQAARRRPNQ